MIKCFVAAGLVVFFASCSVLKNTDSSYRKSDQESSYQINKSLLEKRDWLNKRSGITLYADSSNQDYTIQLWPKGRFSYSAETGFTGEADKVLISGRSNKGSSSSRMVHAEESDQGKTEIQTNLKEGASSSQKDKLKKSSVSWKVVLAFTVLILIAAWAAYRKITKVIKT